MAFGRTICMCCVKEVLDSDRGLLCDSKCERWFHKKCVNLSDSEYKALSADSKKKWFCGRADCTSAREDPLAKLSTQIAGLVDKFSQLATKDEIKAINDGIYNLKESVDLRLAKVESKVDELESKINNLKSLPASDIGFEEVISEMSDRNRRVFNVLIYNLPESQAKNTETRINHDKNKLQGLATAIDFPLITDDVKMVRLGKPTRNKSRPLKVIFKSILEVKSFLDHYAKANLKNGSSTFSNTMVSRDRTFREREHLASMRKELEDRTQRGEKNLTIKYRNGVPSIVQQSKND